MPQFMCIRDCQYQKTPGAKPVFRRAGSREICKEKPSKHWIRLNSDNSRQDLYDILCGMVEEMGIEIDKTWDVPQLQNIIDAEEKKQKEPEEEDRIKSALTAMDIKFDGRLGLTKLKKLAKDNNVVW